MTKPHIMCQIHLFTGDNQNNQLHLTSELMSVLKIRLQYARMLLDCSRFLECIAIDNQAVAI